jgi:YfiH family protein
MFDRGRRAVAAVHSGWRGTVGGIAGRVIEHLREAYGSRPDDVEVWLGPSIRSCCYEVDERVADEVRRVFGHTPLQPRFARPGKYWLSLQACIRQDLVRHGVRPEDIHDTGVCTACRTRHLFSHRAEHGRTGRLLGAIQIRPS